MFYTLSESEAVTQVSLLIEGQKVSTFGDQGLLVSSPWQRESDTLPVW